MKKCIFVHTEKAFLEALENSEGNILIIYNDQQIIIPIKVDAREYVKKRGMIEDVEKRRSDRMY